MKNSSHIYGLSKRPREQTLGANVCNMFHLRHPQLATKTQPSDQAVNRALNLSRNRFNVELDAPCSPFGRPKAPS